ncbi:MAG: transglutaminase domain-containing protein [Chitinophagaceae bacterium]
MAFSQSYANYDSIDNRVLWINSNDPATLSELLTAPYHTDKEKVRAIFRWITQHISYYRPMVKSNKKNKTANFFYGYASLEVDTGDLKPLTERIAINTLVNRRAICDGYSRLFKSLCDHACIPAEIITGYARSDVDRVEQKFRSNHSWNAVYIDSAWQLLDVTWASGYLNRSNDDFIRYYDDYYFLTPPQDFIRHHYPDDLRWTLLERTPPLYEFRYMPFRPRSYVKYDIKDYYPSRGIIDAKLGDTIHLELETNVPYRNVSIAPDSLWEESTLVTDPSFAYLNPVAIGSGKKVTYSFAVNSELVEWLYIMYNNDAVLRYRVNIKKDKDRDKK